MAIAYHDHPIDERSAARLAEQGLRFALLDWNDTPAATAWLGAVNRGFLGPRSTPEAIAQSIAYLSGIRRPSGVWDDSSPTPAVPVGTVDGWAMPLTVPGEREVTGWAISGVSVAATHRRRGIASALLEAELRTASALGVPIAMLTVSEATIYERFGFAPSAPVAERSIKSRRAGWRGAPTDGRLCLVEKEDIVVAGLELVNRIRTRRPGEVGYAGNLWERQLGYSLSDENAKATRIVRYDDASGELQGFAVYRLTGGEPDFAEHELLLEVLVTATDDAYRALWRYALEHDLVSTVTAHLRPLVEPIDWLVTDQRSITTTISDHHWIRILDLPAALQARTYGAEGSLVIAIDDPLHFAEGVWELSTDSEGRAAVAPTDRLPQLEMAVNSLAAIYLGGAAPSLLAAAGRITELEPGSLRIADDLFRSRVMPSLSIWY